MYCMKCGVEIPEKQVFCDHCREEMQKHPVKPGTPVNLPNRKQPAIIKGGRLLDLQPEEQIAQLRKKLKFTRLVLLTVLLLLAMSIVALFLRKPADIPDISDEPIGRNFTVDDESTDCATTNPFETKFSAGYSQ